MRHLNATLLPVNQKNRRVDLSTDNNTDFEPMVDKIDPTAIL